MQNDDVVLMLHGMYVPLTLVATYDYAPRIAEGMKYVLISSVILICAAS